MTTEKQFVENLRYVIRSDGSRAASLIDALDPGDIISIVGAGGKTSTMYTLGCQLAETGEDVVLTTTTRIKPFANEFPFGMTLQAVPAENGKLKEPEELFLPHGCRLIVEADGSKGLPVKMPASHEPVILPESDQVIALLGLSGIGRPIGKVCHRPELVCVFLNKTMDDPVTAEDAAKIIASPQGLRKNCGDRRFAVILNQADTEEDIRLGLRIAALLPKDITCILTAYENTH